MSYDFIKISLFKPINDLSFLLFGSAKSNNPTEAGRAALLTPDIQAGELANLLSRIIQQVITFSITEIIPTSIR